MSQFIKEFPSVLPSIHQQIVQSINSSTAPWDNSLLYSTILKDKILDQSVCQSKFRSHMGCDNLFSLVEDMVAEISRIDPNQNYHLIKNDLTEIKYQSGDFFAPRGDSLSVTSNVIEEYTMIICLYADCEGGQTVFHVNPFFKHYSSCSVTTGAIVLFRKDLTHEGNPIISGTKHILTIDLWAIPKKADQIIVIKFPNDKRTHVIGVDRVTAFPNLLHTLYDNFGKNTHIMQHIDEKYTYEEVQVIVDILNQQYISIETFKLHIHGVIGFYLIDPTSILIDQTDRISKSVIDKLHKVNAISLDQPVIICNDVTHQVFLQEQIKEMNIPYISFQIVYIEGTHKHNNIIMTPIWSSFSESHHIDRICTGFKNYNEDIITSKIKDVLSERSIKELETMNGKVEISDDLSDSEEEEEKYEYVNKCVYVLKRGALAGKCCNKPACMRIALNDTNTYCVSHANIVGAKVSILPVLKSVPINAVPTNPSIILKFNEQDSSNLVLLADLKFCQNMDLSHIIKCVSSLYQKEWCNNIFVPIENSNENYGFFSIKDNKTYLNKDQIADLRNRLETLDFYQLILNKIADIPFIFPQQKIEISEHYESIYGNLNIFTIHGFIRMINHAL